MNGQSLFLSKREKSIRVWYLLLFPNEGDMLKVNRIAQTYRNSILASYTYSVYALSNKTAPVELILSWVQNNIPLLRPPEMKTSYLF